MKCNLSLQWMLWYVVNRFLRIQQRLISLPHLYFLSESGLTDALKQIKTVAFGIDKNSFQVYKQAHILVSRGVCTNTGYCPKMSKDANGYTRYCRLKALPKVAGSFSTLEVITSLTYLSCLSGQPTLCTAKSQPERKIRLALSKGLPPKTFFISKLEAIFCAYLAENSFVNLLILFNRAGDGRK